MAPQRPVIRVQCTGDVCRQDSFNSYTGHRNGAFGTATTHARTATTTAAIPSSTAINFDPMDPVKTWDDLGGEGLRHGRGHGDGVAFRHDTAVPAVVSVRAAAYAGTATDTGSIAHAAAVAASGIAWGRIL